MDKQQLELNITPEDFTITSLDDEIRADRQCTELLKGFAATLVKEQKMEALEAGKLAHGADPFLRDFMIADRQENLFTPSPGRVRQFAGHYYIVNTLEPNRTELVGMLDGIEAFYRFSHEMGWTNDDSLAAISEECSAIDEYCQRIESFWDLKDDGYLQWRDEIPIR